MVNCTIVISIGQQHRIANPDLKMNQVNELRPCSIFVMREHIAPQNIALCKFER
jgi:hypothetical protein